MFSRGRFAAQFLGEKFRGVLKTVKCSKAQIYISSAKTFKAYKYLNAILNQNIFLNRD